MHALLSAILLTLCAHSVTHAASFICQPESYITGAKTLTFDTERRTARYSDAFGKEFSGRVSSIRKHSDGLKVNLSFDIPKDVFGIDVYEYAIFPTGKNSYQIIGVGFSMIDGSKQITHLAANSPATCIIL